MRAAGFVLDPAPAILSAFLVFFRSRLAASLEVLALRQHIAVLKGKRPRPLLNGLDRVFWTTLGSGIASLRVSNKRKSG
jgi:hypothetical protein